MQHLPLNARLRERVVVEDGVQQRRDAPVIRYYCYYCFLSDPKQGDLRIKINSITQIFRQCDSGEMVASKKSRKKRWIRDVLIKSIHLYNIDWLRSGRSLTRTSLPPPAAVSQCPVGRRRMNRPEN